LPGAIELRHRLHTHAEVSHREDVTVRILADALPAGRVERVAGRSLLARAVPGPAAHVVLRAEMDALPIEEDTGVDYACRTGAMHACGHDVHMAALVALYRALASLGDGLGVSCSALFQHSEETYPSGAKEVLESGALDHAAAVVASHVHPEVAWGSATADSGAINAACDFFHVIMRGRGGHAAYPHRARDVIAALCQMVGILQQVTDRSIDPLHGSVLSVGYVRAGASHNALPDHAEAGGTFRTLVEEDRKRMPSLITEVVRGVADSFGCVGEVEFSFGEPPLVNDSRLAEGARTQLEAFGFEIGDDLRSCGSDDFGYFCEALPSMMTFVGVRGAMHEEGVSLHHSRFLPQDKAVEAVARAQLAGLLAAAELYGRPGGVRSR
jgi:amidohydrolase